ncbi:MAG: hypothetical protein IPM83_16455 [Ignavibacteria bacterium]|nr:hypothetical protein [Ignavibacteria bacterium]
MITERNDRCVVSGLRRLYFDFHDAIDLYAKDEAKGRVEIEAVIHDICKRGSGGGESNQAKG